MGELIELESASRFVIWRAASEANCSRTDLFSLNELLSAIGLHSFHELHGKTINDVGERSAELGGIIARNQLGQLVHCWSRPTHESNPRQSHAATEACVADLDLSFRSNNCLLNAGIATVAELVAWSADDLLQLRNMGRKSTSEIVDRLLELGLNLRASETEPPPAAEKRAQPDSAQDALSSNLQLLLLLDLTECQLPPMIKRKLTSAGIFRIVDAVPCRPGVLRSRAGLKEQELVDLQRWLVHRGLRIGMTVPPWIREYQGELREAFRSEIEHADVENAGSASRLDETACTVKVPDSLDAEVETYFAPRAKDRKREMIGRLLGWDGSAGTTLEQAANEFGLTRQALQQHQQSGLRAPGSLEMPFLRKAVAAIESCAPAVAEKAEHALLEAAIVRRSWRCESIAATARHFGLDVPWRVFTSNGARLVVHRSATQQLEKFIAEAKGRVSHFGAARKPALAEHFSGELAEETINVYLAACNGLVWLDDDCDWFWLPTAQNPLLNRLAKILRAAPRLPLEEAWSGVFRDRRMEHAGVPLSVFHALCTTIPWCRVDSGEISAVEGIPGAEEQEDDSNQSVLQRLLIQHGPVLRRQDLWRYAREHGIGKVSFDRLLTESNIIVNHGPEIWGLIGSDRTQLVTAPEVAISENDCLSSVDTAQSSPQDASCGSQGSSVLSDCQPGSPSFPFQVLHRLLARCASLRQLGAWSICELLLSRSDKAVLASWAATGQVELRVLTGQRVQVDGKTYVGMEALALTFLALCCQIARIAAVEGDLWRHVYDGLGPALRSALFLRESVPKPQLRDATEAICSRLGARHVFGREGEQSWLRTVFLQFGMTCIGWKRLPWWLTQCSVLPVAIEDLLNSDSLRSDSFSALWKTLQSYRRANLSRPRAAGILAQNPWIDPEEIDAILGAAAAQRELQQGSVPDIEHQEITPTGLVDSPRLNWHGDAPCFELFVRPYSKWLTEPRYVIVLDDIRRVGLRKDGDSYNLEEPLEVGLEHKTVKIDLRRKQVSCLPEPIEIVLAPEAYEYAFYDLRTGTMLPHGEETPSDSKPYALLCKSACEVSTDSLETRSVFGGAWVIRAYRNGLPNALEIRKGPSVLWMRPADVVGDQCSRSKALLTCHGGNWGEPALFAIASLPPGLQPACVIIDGRRLALEHTAQRGYSVALILEPAIVYGTVSVCVEGTWRGRLRWIPAHLEFESPPTGIVVETEAGWKVFKEAADMDIEYLRVRRVFANVRSILGAEQSDDDQWIWMEGDHMCIRPRTKPVILGSALYGCGGSLRLTRGPYNTERGGHRLGRSVIHSGVIERVDPAPTGCVLQLRQTIELEADHAIWAWLPGHAQPECVKREFWNQDEELVYVNSSSEEEPIAYALCFEGAWLGARTFRRGWAGIAEIIRTSCDWEQTAAWLRWWRAPLMHEALREVTRERVTADRLTTLRAWLAMKETSLARLSEEHGDAWRGLTRSFFWNWSPSDREAGLVLSQFDLLTGDPNDDLRRAWETYESFLAIDPLLLVRLACRGILAQYPNASESDRGVLLEYLRNRILDLTLSTARSTAEIALNDARIEAAKQMGVDEFFVAKSLLRDAVALIKGEQINDDNIRTAVANSHSVRRYVAAALIDRCVKGDLY